MSLAISKNYPQHISSLSPNKFVCIQFPLNNPDSTKSSLISQPSSTSSSSSSLSNPNATNNLSRFHSFRLNDKLASTSSKETPSSNSNNLSVEHKTKFANESMNNTSSVSSESSCASSPTTPPAITNELAKLSLQPQLNALESQLAKTKTKLKSKTATVVISLRKSMRRKDKKLPKTNEQTEPRAINSGEADNLPKITFDSASSYYDNEEAELSSSKQQIQKSNTFATTDLSKSGDLLGVQASNVNNSSVLSSSSSASLYSLSPPPPLDSSRQQLIKQNKLLSSIHKLPQSYEIVQSKKLNAINSNECLVGYLEPDLSAKKLNSSVSANNMLLPTNEADLNNNSSAKRRERRDSGVGGSLTRDIGKRREKWNSFVKSHRPSFKSASTLQMSSLSVKQFSKLKKFSLVRITALMEKYSQQCQKSGWNRFKTVPKFIKRHQKSVDQTLYKNKLVFGVPLKLNYQRHGQPLPQAVIQVMKFLRSRAQNTVGIFRKSGSKSRMGLLRELVEKTNSFSVAEFEKFVNINSDLNSIGSGFSSQSTSKSDLVEDEKSSINVELLCIDLADVLKQYFRELPECLFTNKLSTTLLDIFTYLPEHERLEAVQYCMILLDDENRDALQCLLYLLHDISRHHDVHKMDVRNISICLAPSLLNMNNNLKDLASIPASIATSPTSPVYKDPTQLMQRQCNASLECLSLMIENPKKIFQIPNEAYTKCQFTKTDYSVSLTLNELLGNYSTSMLNMYLTDRIEEMIKELKDKPKNWNRLRNDSQVDIAYKVIEDDDYHLRLWKLCIELDCSANEALNKILKCRSQWDENLLESRVVETLANQADIVQYVMSFMAPQPTRDFCELRCWREASYLGQKYSHVVYSTSIEHENVQMLGDIRANTLKNFYLIESNTLNGNKCFLYQLYRADYRGYSAEWYNKMQGHLLKQCLLNLKACLQQPK